MIMSLKSRLLLAFFGLFFCQIILAQPLNGTYTIGGSNPDFITINSAIAALNNNGVNAPVVFNIRNGSYLELLLISPITGASATNTVTFQGESGDSSLVVINGSTNSNQQNTVRLDTVAYLTMKHLSIIQSPNVNNNAALFINKGKYCTFSHCKIWGHYSSNSSASDYGIQGINDTNMVFTKCNIRGGASGNYFGNIGSNHTKLLIDSCEIIGEVFMDKGTFSTLSNSTVSGRVVLQQTSRTNILNNFLQNMLQLISCSGYPQIPMKIYNNVILGGSYQGSVAYGFWTNSSSYFDFYHNTIYMNTPTMSGYAIYINPSTGIVNVKNNIVYRYDSNTSNYIFRYPNIEAYVGYINSDNNLYYRNGTSFSINYTSLQAFADSTDLDSNSVYADPIFGTVNFADVNSYKATSNILNNFTTSLSSVTTDINGNPRNPAHPTAGAFEMDGPPSAMITNQLLQVCASVDTTLYANFISNTSLNYAWYKNDSLINNANTSSLFFTNVQDTDSATYLCIASNNLGSDSVTFSFEIKHPPITSIAMAQGSNSACEGDSVLLIGNDNSGMWNDMSTNPQLYATQSGNYSITNSNQCGVSVSNMFGVVIHAIPVPSITYQDTMLVCTPSGLSYQWYFNNAPLIGNSNTLTTSADGVYSVVLIDSNGCSGTSTSFNLITTEINKNKNLTAISIYPNPAANELHIQMSSSTQVIQVYDVLGNELHLPLKIQNNIHTLNIQELSKGMYFLKMKDASLKFWKE
jgi:hypothetical protein